MRDLFFGFNDIFSRYIRYIENEIGATKMTKRIIEVNPLSEKKRIKRGLEYIY